MDLARSIQAVTEEIMLRLARTLHKETGVENLCLAGGVALNCVGNGRILREGPFKSMWIQPAAGDAGGAVGVAMTAAHRYFKIPRVAGGNADAMKGSFLGPQFSNEEIERFLTEKNLPYVRLPDEQLFERVTEELTREKVIGWFQGQMEFGPRALGGRSIIGDPRSEKMQSVMNLKIKYRESFRPFAPSVILERVSDYFEMSTDSPYMLLVAPVKEELRFELTDEQKELWGIDLLKVKRSKLPAITHVDYSARVQTVDSVNNPRYYRLIETFEAKTGCGVLINTSFNVRGEPIVCTPADAYKCFMRTEMDMLVLENCILFKEEQPPWSESSDWRKEFELD
jgi:carbamoyltransferase